MRVPEKTLVTKTDFRSYAEWQNFINACKADGTFYRAGQRRRGYWVQYFKWVFVEK